MLGVVLAFLVASWFAACAWLAWRNPRVEFTREELARTPAPLPDGFLWGTASAAHQVEGGNRNDWTRFEAEPGRIENGDTSAVAVDGWNRMSEDIALMKQLRANAYRFSIEWSRLEPREGEWDEAAWARYAQFVKDLRAAGITPMVTLLHFTLPLWIADDEGVVAPAFPARFARFAAEAGRRLGADVDLWVTLNEPVVQTFMGYLEGNWPPRARDPLKGTAAFRGLLRAHAAAATALRTADPGAKVGVAHNLMQLEPRSRLMLGDWLAAGFVDGFWNWSFPDAIRDGRARLRLPGARLDERMPELVGSADFFGLNYYFRYRVRLAPGSERTVEMEPGPTALRSELGGRDPVGDSPPEALYALIGEAWRRYRMPVYVTEGGIADERGTMRGTLIRGQREAIARALADGVDVRGYLHWSLLDNFEWDKGYRPRFGLFRVDRQTLARTPAGGADVFTALAP